MSRILNHDQNTAKYAHLTRQGEARKWGRKLPWDDPAWQKRIREAKKAVADAQAKQLRYDDYDDRGVSPICLSPFTIRCLRS